MKEEILIVINPHAGSGSHKKRQALAQLLRVAGDFGQVIQEENLADLKTALDAALKRRPKVACIFGGDGTTNHFLNIVLKNHAIEDLPLILPLRGGTMNILAKDANLDIEADQALQLLSGALKGNPSLPFIRKGVLRICVDKGGEHKGKKKEKFYGLTFAKGLPYEMMREYDHLLPSRMNAVRLVLRAMLWPAFRNRVAGMRRMVIGLDDAKPLEGEFLGTVLSTVNRTVLGWKPFWRDIEYPEKKISFLASSIPLTGLLPFFPAVFWGVGKELLKARGYLYQQVGEVWIESDRGFTLDGEQQNIDQKNRVEVSLAGVIKIPQLNHAGV